MSKTLRVREVSAIDAALSDAIHQIYNRVFDVLIVRDVFDRAQLAGAVEQLAEHDPRYPWTLQLEQDASVEQMRVMGQTLTPVMGEHMDLAAYFAVADRFRQHLRTLAPDFVPTLERQLAALSGARPVAMAQSPGGTYTPATIRDLPPGHDIPVHCGNFFLRSSGYRELAKVAALEDQLSYFTPMQTPESGGELLVYELQWGDPATPMRAQGIFDGSAIEKAEPAAVLNPGAGDLLLFDGGRYYHKVAPVAGARHRWTIGGFVGFTKDFSRVIYWS